MQQERDDGASLLNDFAARLLPLLKDGLEAVLPSSKGVVGSAEPRMNMLSAPNRHLHPPPVQSSSPMQASLGRPRNESPPGTRSAKQMPPPPPDAPAQVFPELTRGPENGRRTERVLEMRKKEMEAELDSDLKQLDSERKEGLYRLDWELAEAIEALHAKHAELANEKIRQHRELMGELERRAQAGEELTPEQIRQMKSPKRDQQAELEFYMETHGSEEAEEESEEESDEEGMLSSVINFFRGKDEQPHSAHLEYEDENGSEYGSEYATDYSGSYVAAPPAQYYQEEGATGHHENMIGLGDLPTYAGSFSGPPRNSGSASMQVGGPSSATNAMWPPANVYHGSHLV